MQTPEIPEYPTVVEEEVAQTPELARTPEVEPKDGSNENDNPDLGNLEHVDSTNVMAQQTYAHVYRNTIDTFIASNSRVCILFFFVLIGIIFAIIYAVKRSMGNTEAEDMSLTGYGSAAVAADTRMCANVGKVILLKGGNAVDAAIATLVCNGLGSPQSMGIGGGFFMTIYDRTTKHSTVIDAREVAPIKATPDMFVADKSTSAVGGLSIAVPGEIKGYWHAHQKYGKMPWSELFAPSVKLAHDGFPVSKGLAMALADSQQFILAEPSLKSLFKNTQTGELYKEDEIIKMPELAYTLQAISVEGASAFYNGSLTGAIIDDLKDVGSIIIREDLQSYKVKEKNPVQIKLSNGLRAFAPPAPGGGPVLSLILNILDGFAFKREDIATVANRIKTYHQFIETFKFAFAQRTHLGDTDFIDIKEIIQNLTSREYADIIRHRIVDLKTFDYQHYGANYYSMLKNSTSHVSVLDKLGYAVSVTSTINARFGCRRRGRRTGIIFNDQMDDFSTPNITNEWGIDPSPANFIQPGKRPLSSMSPVIFIANNDTVSTTIGASGAGPMIITSISWVAAHLLWLGQNVDQAVSMARMHHQLLPSVVHYEQGFEKEVVQGLINIGHNVSEFKPVLSAINAINVWNNRLFPKSDQRKGAAADGF